MEDIRLHLLSRHGLKDVYLEAIAELVGRTAEQERSEEVFVDLVQQVALLLIPELVTMKEEESFVACILRIWKQDAAIGTESCETLSREDLQALLECYGEQWPESVVDAMLERAQEDPRFFSSDVAAANETTSSSTTTHYQDACREGKPLPRVCTAACLDHNADTFLSFSWTIFAWLSLVFAFIAFFIKGYGEVEGGVFTLNSCSEVSEFTCTLFGGVVRWIGIFIKLTVVRASSPHVWFDCDRRSSTGRSEWRSF